MTTEPGEVEPTGWRLARELAVYDGTMERVSVDERAATRAITIAEHREWPDRLDWDEGPDALRYPDLYTPAEPDDQDDEEDDLEPLDLHERDTIG
ncbi:hypothetical protein [Micromonospora sp. NPDC047134]|uniref:hypothetical protein n=1 Tax=Micromonospora sp. NPDC047134 TaxID=3154340 RepID=UPI0033F0A081